MATTQSKINPAVDDFGRSSKGPAIPAQRRPGNRVGTIDQDAPKLWRAEYNRQEQIRDKNHGWRHLVNASVLDAC
ncbi:hypothetical protein ON010_g7454 [Phytophthora cinnamomi]|nr:hypothetical protein ON010_g7454 [Phytophthora cinnamomi]